MSSSESFSDEMPDVIVALNITETNSTINGSRAKFFPKTPHEDTSITNIIIGIGAVAVILFILLIIIKLIHKCYKMYITDDDDTKDAAKKSPLLPSSASHVAYRRSSIRDSLAPVHRSSLDINTQMAIRQNRLSQTYSNTPPSVKKS